MTAHDLLGTPPARADVFIAGGGPCGLMLANELGRRAIATVLVDDKPGTAFNPQANATQARTMEHFRRLGFADEVRALGMPDDFPTDVAYFTFSRPYPRWLDPRRFDRAPAGAGSPAGVPALDYRSPRSWRETARRISAFEPDVLVAPWWTSFWAVPFRSVFRAVERWTLDEFPMPGQLFEDVLDGLYRDDRFRRGLLDVGGRRTGLERLRAPVLAVVNPLGGVVPPASMTAGLAAAPDAPAVVLEYEGDRGPMLQHVGPLVSRLAHERLWPQIFDWLAERGGPARRPNGAAEG